jgi:predicted tellurium resistance membrane protein TerC
MMPSVRVALGVMLSLAFSALIVAGPVAVAADQGATSGVAEAEGTKITSEDFFSVGGILTLGMLILLQAVLGFDNLLYISIESKRVRPEKQSYVRKLGISLAIILRIVLLFVVIKLVALLEDPFIEFSSEYFSGAISGHSLIVLAGGSFILWTAMREIYHLLVFEETGHGSESGGDKSVAKAVTLIVIMNLVFSFDSILSAMALTRNFWIMATAIILSGILMIWLADRVAEFLKRNRMYEVLGLFILFIVGVMLVSEGGHLAQLEFFGHHVTQMAKSTFYFVLAVLIVVDIVQSRYQKKLLAQREAKQEASLGTT